MLLVFLLLFTQASTQEDDPSPSVTLTHGGTVRGVRIRVDSTLQFEAFRDIPYGFTPFRFSPPIPYPGWPGVRNATQESVVCPQPPMFDPSLPLLGTEDCLVLQVFVPLTPSPPLPVMVYIHGGGFNRGSGRTDLYGPDHLLRHGIVLVNINYRLGPFGFLSTGDSAAAGNWGLMDQLEALKWVQREIKAFGGDPSKVTLFGESAGGASVSFLQLSPLSTGLFHRAIAQSGSSLDVWSLTARPKDKAVHLAESLQCPDLTDSQAIVDCLRTKDAMDIVRASVSDINDFHDDHPHRTFSVVVDGYILPGDPLALLKSGRLGNPVPTITGRMDEEGLFLMPMALMATDDQIKDINEHFLTRVCPRLLKLEEHRPADLPTVCRRIKEHFLGDDDIEITFQHARVLSHMIGERFFHIGHLKQLQQLSKWVPTYHYIIDFVPETSYLKDVWLRLAGAKETEDKRHQLELRWERNIPKGAGHGDDVGYLFSGTVFPQPQANSPLAQMVQRMTELWTSFARHGNMDQVAPEWKPWTVEEPATFVINNAPRISYTRTPNHLLVSWERLLEPPMEETCWAED
ncbi:unnamed protein product [Cyprideis torosa]|uniref:Carboxylic ester hydrolase n=1 Tax=Cyprideis torosa TaxID=163714 RepID=A0A7R8WH98_9CRUS|nr:unnamed protein product [Cyprideis torosa]CAG0896366.1 unnamed protein product [Cyprideis torosa]